MIISEKGANVLNRHGVTVNYALTPNFHVWLDITTAIINDDNNKCHIPIGKKIEASTFLTTERMH